MDAAEAVSGGSDHRVLKQVEASAVVLDLCRGLRTPRAAYRAGNTISRRPEVSGVKRLCSLG